jgi:cysteine desulfurase family protein
VEQIYFDNTSTSFPKPKQVIEAINNYLINIGVNQGRAGYKLAIDAGQIVFNARKKLAKLFGIKNPMHIVFGFNATDTLNLAIKGVVKKGDHVITSSMEHNSVIRPLNELKQSNLISLSIIQAEENGIVNVSEIEKKITDQTRAVIFNHVSNLNSCIQPVKEIGRLCKKHGLTFIVDGAQSAGILPFNINESNIDLYAFTGHKSLFGAQGVGGLIIADDYNFKKIKTLKQGGTGSLSDKTLQPDFLPDCFESGTLNISGIAGLLAGVDFILEKGIENIYKHEKELLTYFVEKAYANVSGFKAIGYSSDCIGVCAFLIEGISVSKVAGLLSDNYGIMSRSGLHCAPLAHQTLGTYPHGTLRFGFNIFNTKKQIDIAVNALIEIAP